MDIQLLLLLVYHSITYTLNNTFTFLRLIIYRSRFIQWTVHCQNALHFLYKDSRSFISQKGISKQCKLQLPNEDLLSNSKVSFTQIVPVVSCYCAEGLIFEQILDIYFDNRVHLNTFKTIIVVCTWLCANCLYTIS